MLILEESSPYTAQSCQQLRSGTSTLTRGKWTMDTCMSCVTHFQYGDHIRSVCVGLSVTLYMCMHSVCTMCASMSLYAGF